MNNQTATIIADSINPDGNRLTTFCVRIPRILLAELNTHREASRDNFYETFSRNAASSRAIPVDAMLQRVMDDPYIPEFGYNAKGMQNKGELTDVDKMIATKEWLDLRDNAVKTVKCLQQLKVHKQDVNRLLEPFMYIDWLVSATRWSNFFFQRVHSAASPGFQKFAYDMAKLYFTQYPSERKWGEWHLPYVTMGDVVIVSNRSETKIQRDSMLAQVSTARCARISYYKHGEKEGVEEDLDWYARHVQDNVDKGQPVHVSPAEHVGYAYRGRDKNYQGWMQFRSTIANETYDDYTLEDLNRYEDEKGYELTL